MYMKRVIESIIPCVLCISQTYFVYLLVMQNKTERFNAFYHVATDWISPKLISHLDIYQLLTISIIRIHDFILLCWFKVAFSLNLCIPWNVIVRFFPSSLSHSDYFFPVWQRSMYFFSLVICYVFNSDDCHVFSRVINICSQLKLKRIGREAAASI